MIKKLTIIALGAFFFACNDDDDEPVDQFQIELNTIDNYLQQNGIQVSIDPATSIRYEIQDFGTGIQFYTADSIRLDITEQNLESGIIYRQESNAVVNQLPAGTAQALRNISEGGTITAYIPSLFAYGNNGSEGVPPNTPIITVTTLIEVYNQRLFNEIDSIDNVLIRDGISFQTHPTGIRYVLNQSDGERPSYNSQVTINYAGRILSRDINFDSGNEVTFNLNQLIPGWQIMLPLVEEGGSITIYLPSSFGYGSRGAGISIPPHAILEFDIELITVVQ